MDNATSIYLCLQQFIIHFSVFKIKYIIYYLYINQFEIVWTALSVHMLQQGKYCVEILTG